MRFYRGRSNLLCSIVYLFPKFYDNLLKTFLSYPVHKQTDKQTNSVETVPLSKVVEVITSQIRVQGQD